MNEQYNDHDYENWVKGRQPQRKFRPTHIVSLSIIVFLLLIWFWWVYLGDHIPDQAKRAEVWVQSLLSTAILIVVAIQACIYFRQAIALDRQVRHSARQSRMAREQIKIAGDSLINTARAYGGVAKIFFTGAESNTVFIEVQNVGHVPAERVKLSFDAVVY